MFQTTNQSIELYHIIFSRLGYSTPIQTVNFFRCSKLPITSATAVIQR